MFVRFETFKLMFSLSLILLTLITALPPSLSSVAPLYTRCRLHAEDQRRFCRVSEANSIQLTFQHIQQCANYCEQLNAQHPAYTSKHNYTQQHSQLNPTTTFNSISYLYASNFSKAPHVRLSEETPAFRACYAFNFSPADRNCLLFPHSPTTTTPYRFHRADPSCTYYEVSLTMK